MTADHVSRAIARSPPPPGARAPPRGPSAGRRSSSAGSCARCRCTTAPGARRRGRGRPAGPIDSRSGRPCRRRARRTDELDQRVARRDRRLAVAAATPQQQPGDDRDVVPLPDRRAAGRAGRSRRDDRLVSGHPVDDDVQERSDGETQDGTQPDEQSEHGREEIRSRTPESSRPDASASRRSSVGSRWTVLALASVFAEVSTVPQGPVARRSVVLDGSSLAVGRNGRTRPQNERTPAFRSGHVPRPAVARMGMCSGLVRCHWAFFVLLVLVLGGPSNRRLGGIHVFDVGHRSRSSLLRLSESPVVSGTTDRPLPASRRSIRSYPRPSRRCARRIRACRSRPPAALGPHCSNGPDAMFHWALSTKAFHVTYDIGYVGWLFLMAGAVAFLRAVGRGRCVWEPATLLVLACLPPVWSALENVFHPEDLIAMGLALGGVACAMRRWWAWAGVLLALAVLSQQFALLVAAPLFVVAPPDRRLRYLLAGLGTSLAVVLPLITFTSNRVVRAITLGSGDSIGAGGTAVRLLRLHGPLLVGVSRVLPIILSMALAWWLMRRLGEAVLTPLP